MKNPTSKQLRLVINNLISVNDAAEAEYQGGFYKCRIPLLDMARCALATEGSLCGTPMCHGGWYAVAREMFYPQTHFNGRAYDYEDGAEAMAQDLGFKSVGYLEDWAHFNGKIWGNEHGYSMFSSNQAFVTYGTDLSKLSQIINHWIKVHNRIYKRAIKEI